jgi:PEGA domain
MNPTRIALATALLLVGSATAAQAQKPGHTTLVVTSKPMAQVYVDSASVGTTPCKVTVGAGQHRVELRTTDGRTQTFRITFTAGKKRTLRHRFPPARKGGTGYLSVTSTPWAQVFVGGRAVGTTPMSRFALTARSYLVELKTSTGQTYTRRIYVLAKRNNAFHHDFPKKKKAPLPAAWLWVRSRPPSTVTVNGKPVGTTPLRDIEVRPGKATVVLTTADGRRHQRVMFIPKDKTAKLQHIFKPRPRKAQRVHVGWLMITANRRARVNVDGKNVGFTPIRRLAVNPGKHRVILRSGAKRRTVYVHTTARFTKRVHIRFR